MEDISILSKKASEALYEYSILTFDRIDNIQSRWFSHELFMFQQILVTCQLSSESILILIWHEKIWDAEIIFRPVLEGTIKALYLSIGSIDEKHEKYLDFWNRLPDLDFLKRSGKVEKMLDLINKKGDPYFKDIQDTILSDKEKERIDSLYPKKQRDELKKRWDFNNILKKIAEDNTLNMNFKTLAWLGWNYQNLSNVVHMDATAINVIRERNTRDNKKEVELVYYTHSLRTLNETLLLSKFRLDCVSLWDNQQLGKDDKLSKFHDEIRAEYKKAIKESYSLSGDKNTI